MLQTSHLWGSSLVSLDCQSTVTPTPPWKAHSIVASGSQEVGGSEQEKKCDFFSLSHIDLWQELI